ncbi:MAG: hypothetical protein WCO56_15415 [Verrucomicrobiota bacterium]
MKISYSWKVTGALAALILLSVVVGVFLGIRLARLKQAQASNPARWNETVMKSLDQKLKPTPEQRRQFQTDIDTAVDELKRIREETIQRSTKVIGKLVADVDQRLTPEQKAAFESMKPKAQDLNSLDVLKVEPRKKP